jgi:hypothetical protein
MIVALVPMVVAVSPVGAAAPDVALAVTQPVVSIPVIATHATHALLDSGVLALVGTALMALASLVRRTTRN